MSNDTLFDPPVTYLAASVPRRKIHHFRASYGDLLRSRGIALVRIQYQGQSGSQELFWVRAFRSALEEELLPFDSRIDEWIREYFGALLVECNPEWQEGLGSSGEFEWNILRDRILQNHWRRTLSVQHHRDEDL